SEPAAKASSGRTAPIVTSSAKAPISIRMKVPANCSRRRDPMTDRMIRMLRTIEGVGAGAPVIGRSRSGDGGFDLVQEQASRSTYAEAGRIGSVFERRTGVRFNLQR